jgi:hypothetical protein
MKDASDIVVALIDLDVLIDDLKASTVDFDMSISAGLIQSAVQSIQESITLLERFKSDIDREFILHNLKLIDTLVNMSLRLPFLRSRFIGTMHTSVDICIQLLPLAKD